jgi:hypothetical protein
MRAVAAGARAGVGPPPHKPVPAFHDLIDERAAGMTDDPTGNPAAFRSD